MRWNGTRAALADPVAARFWYGEGGLAVFDIDHSAKRLNTQQYWEVPTKAGVGTLAVSFAGQPDLFAVEFQVQEEKILMCTPKAKCSSSSPSTLRSPLKPKGFWLGRHGVWSSKERPVSFKAGLSIHALQEKGLQPWSKDGVLVEITPAAVLGRRMKASSVQE